MKNTNSNRVTGDYILNVLESMPDGFCTLDKNWKFTYINKRLSSILDQNKESLIGKNIWECFPPAVHSKFYTVYHEAMEKHQSMMVEDYYAPLNTWFEVNIHPTNEGLSFFIKDVTGRKQQEQRVEFISKATSEVIWEYNLEADLLFLEGKKYEALFGYPSPAPGISYSYWNDKIAPEDLKAAAGNREYALANHLHFYLAEYKMMKADGSLAYVRDRVYIIRNNSGQAISLVGAMEDVTMEKLSEKALMKSNESYRLLFDHAPLPTIIFDPESFSILDANVAAIELYGYSREELLSLTVLQMHPEEFHESVREATKSMNNTSGNKIPMITHIKKGGQRMLVDVWAMYIQYQTKTAVLASANDITEKVKLQKQVLKEKVNFQKNITRATLEAQEKERADLAAELHDNVNQLLAAARLNIENTWHYPEQTDHFITKGSGLLQNAIDEIRRLSKSLSSPTLSGLSFYEALHSLLATYNDLELFKISHHFHFDESLLNNGLCLAIYRILQELINNTIKYARASLVSISIYNTEDTLEINYEDNGVGFDMASVKRGMGLNNIQNRVEAYNGKLQIITSRNNGICLHVTVPL